MVESDAGHSATPDSPRLGGRRRGALVGSAVALTLAVAGVGGAVLADPDGPLAERLGVARDEADPAPASVPAPAGLGISAPPPAGPVARPLAAVPLDPRAVRRAAKAVSVPRMGSRVAVAVAGPDGDPVWQSGPRSVVPASTMKLLTGLATLEAIGPETRFATTAYLSGRRLTLVGGGDPLLARTPASKAERVAWPERADLTTLARQVAVALEDRGVARIRLLVDSTLFSGPGANPTWEDDYLPDNVVSPISALWVDGGRERPGLPGRSADPARAAAREFASALRDAGVSVLGAPTKAPAPATGEQVGEVLGPTVAALVEHAVATSDNETTEVLGRHVALATGRAASFAGANAAVGEVLTGLGVDLTGSRLRDSSGLSRANRVSVHTLLDVLSVASDPDRPALSTLVGGLPVAGFDGSLSLRFDEPETQGGLGRVRAKTGTLTGVHGLAGTVVGADGAVMLFVALADRVAVEDTLFARERLDLVAARLAACACADGA